MVYCHPPTQLCISDNFDFCEATGVSMFHADAASLSCLWQRAPSLWRRPCGSWFERFVWSSTNTYLPWINVHVCYRWGMHSRISSHAARPCSGDLRRHKMKTFHVLSERNRIERGNGEYCCGLLRRPPSLWRAVQFSGGITDRRLGDCVGAAKPLLSASLKISNCNIRILQLLCYLNVRGWQSSCFQNI